MPEKTVVLIVSTHGPRERPNPHSKKRIRQTIEALENDGYYVVMQREVV